MKRDYEVPGALFKASIAFVLSDDFIEFNYKNFKTACVIEGSVMLLISVKNTKIYNYPYFVLVNGTTGYLNESFLGEIL